LVTTVGVNAVEEFRQAARQAASHAASQAGNRAVPFEGISFGQVSMRRQGNALDQINWTRFQ